MPFKLKNCRFILLPSLNEVPIFYIKFQSELNRHNPFLKLSREGTSEIRVISHSSKSGPLIASIYLNFPQQEVSGNVKRKLIISQVIC